MFASPKECLKWIQVINAFQGSYGRHLARATAVHSATPVVFEHLTGSFRCFKAFSDVFNTYTSIFRIRGICRIRQHLVSGRNQQK